LLYRGGVPIAASTISSGSEGRETPTGVFTILQKEVVHRSRTYDDPTMPYMQRLTSKGVAIHAAIYGYPASHGCIRLPRPCYSSTASPSSARR
jgi:lipoprotein-anchoring transpeptidase ErfK/SrfK